MMNKNEESLQLLVDALKSRPDLFEPCDPFDFKINFKADNLYGFKIIGTSYQIRMSLLLHQIAITGIQGREGSSLWFDLEEVLDQLPEPVQEILVYHLDLFR